MDIASTERPPSPESTLGEFSRAMKGAEAKLRYWVTAATGEHSILLCNFGEPTILL